MTVGGNLILTGMPGAGKSTVGVILAKTLGMDFLDTDLLICRRRNATLQSILDREGLSSFLDLEEDVIRSLRPERTVIATGGSAPLRDGAMEHLKTLGTEGFQVLHGAVPQGGRASRGDHRPLRPERTDHILLQIQKGRKSLPVENALKRGVPPPADQKIGVQKVHAQCFGQNHADGAFSGAGHTGQNQIAAHSHSPIS